MRAICSFNLKDSFTVSIHCNPGCSTACNNSVTRALYFEIETIENISLDGNNGLMVNL